MNNFESCGNFNGGDCIMIKGPAFYGTVTAKPSMITEETVSQLILNQIKTIIARFLALVTAMVTKVDHGN